MQHFFAQLARTPGFTLMLQIIPIISYIVLIVWMCVRQQWMYVAFLLPSVLMYFSHISSRWSAHSDSETQSEEALATSGTGRMFSAARSTTTPLLLSQLEACAHARNRISSPAPRWQSIVHAWLQPSTRVALGVSIDTRVDSTTTSTSAHTESVHFCDLSLDLCNEGPHALVGGTTGSGKSVLLNQWVYMLALRNSPEHVNFVFLDFKGGATFLHSQHLPHCVGNVSNLDIAHATRAIRALVKLMHDREKLLADWGVSDITQLKHPPAKVFIFADEFFVLMSALPQYSQHFSTLISLGRSLGIHFVICTQNPMNQVNAHMKANMPVHLCLRVTDSLQSLELLGSPAAALISPQYAGAAFISHGSGLQPCAIYQPHLNEDFTTACAKARAFMGLPAATSLFSPPFGQVLHRTSAAWPPHSVSSPTALIIGEEDDGIHRFPYALDSSQNRPIVCTAMDADALRLNIASIVDSLQTSAQWYPWQNSKSDLLQAKPSGRAIIVLTKYEPPDAQLSAWLRNPEITLILAVNSWPRFLTQVPPEDRLLWESAVLIVSANAAKNTIIPSRSLSPEVQDILADYPTTHPHRVIIYDSACHCAQLFSTNCDKTLEKLGGVWLPIEKEKD